MDEYEIISDILTRRIRNTATQIRQHIQQWEPTPPPERPTWTSSSTSHSGRFSSMWGR